MMAVIDFEGLEAPISVIDLDTGSLALTLSTGNSGSAPHDLIDRGPGRKQN